MSKDKYDLFNLTTGEYEDLDISASKYMDDIAKMIDYDSIITIVQRELNNGN